MSIQVPESLAKEQKMQTNPERAENQFLADELRFGVRERATDCCHNYLGVVPADQLAWRGLLPLINGHQGAASK